jgi:hypothetical protein
MSAASRGDWFFDGDTLIYRVEMSLADSRWFQPITGNEPIV